MNTSKKYHYKYLSLALAGVFFSCSEVSALEFGGLGNVSAGMGGAGVALKNSQWALYYNPALLGVSKKSRFAYSFGVSVKEENILSLTKVDFKNLQKLPSQIGSLFSNTKTKTTLANPISLSGATTKANDINMGGYFGDVLNNLLGTTNGTKPTDDSLNTFLKDLMGNNGGSSGDLSATIEEFKKQINDEKTGDQLIEKFKDKLESASEAAGGNAIFDSILGNLTPENVKGLVDLVKDGTTNGGNIDVDKVLDKLGGVKISLSDNADLNRAIKDISTIQDTLKRNDFSLMSQNGIVLQLAPRDNVGGFGMGIFLNAFASGSASFDENHNKIIVQSGSNYVELGIGNGDITLSKSDENNYKSSSIFSPDAKHHINAAGLAIVEVPVGYGHSFDVGAGALSIGATIKYLQGIGYSISQNVAIDSISKIKIPNTPIFSQNFGLDIGALYTIGGFSTGIVAKNINNPSFKISSDRTFYLDPQVRAGVAYEWGILNLAFDADLLPNNTLSYTSPKNQMIGGGVMFDFKYFDFRVGAMYDIRNTTDEGVILTGGINLFGFLDIAVQSGLKTITYDKYKIPNHFSIKVGGGFSW
ncbi:hypothetical protein CQA57_04300 [Helicobacter anseris]|uniref:Conjugal transfer protein TraF n=1 Tax=Helicobacter anseris TaxID=375926 RepID=A0A3D8J8Y3_9HELI|nr:conjugal transfer protein TraF [Helicobacter anseris]RDU73892.1 hypothetical protein CQA57_04300 [Helicobacter anseris]